MPASTKLVHVNTVEIRSRDFTKAENEDPLLDIDNSKFDKITTLKFHDCRLTPKAVSTILLKLIKVKKLFIDQCTGHGSVYCEVPVVERKLDILNITVDPLDMQERGDYCDCHEVLLHPRVRLPAVEVIINRKEASDNGRKMGQANGKAYFDLFDMEAERHTYMVSYLERYNTKITFVTFDSGRPKIWKSFAKFNWLRLLDVKFTQDLEAKQKRKISEEDEREALLAAHRDRPMRTRAEKRATKSR